MSAFLKRSPLTAAVAHAIGTPMVVGLAYHGTSRERLTGLDNVWGKHIDAELFERHLAFITRHYRVLPVSEIAQRLQSHKPLPRKCCFITFDDGYVGNYEVAFPLLKKYGCVASFFIATSFIETGRRYPLDVIDAALKHAGKFESDALKAREVFKSLPETEQDEFLRRFAKGRGFHRTADVPELGPHARFMTWAQMREMQTAGMEFGSHTHTHQILARVSEPTAREELRVSKQLLEQNLSRKCEQFCYPNGHFPEDGNEHTNEFVKAAGYSCAIYMSGKVNTKDTSPFMISRNAAGQHTPVNELARILAIAGPRVRNWLRRE